MIDEIQGLINEYTLWLKDNTLLRPINGWVEITTPYLDRHNDYLQIYVKRENNRFLLTDDGYIISDLEQSGCSLDSPRRQKFLNVVLNGLGVKLDGKALVTRASTDNFALQKHNLIQAMLAVDDLFYLAEPVVKSLFLEDVTKWLDMHKIRYTPQVKFTGASGYDYIFDFVIPKSSGQPERLLKAINHPNPEASKSLAWAWVDTKETRPPESRAYAILNDSDGKLSESVSNALQRYGIRPVPWRHRKRFIEELAA